MRRNFTRQECYPLEFMILLLDRILYCEGSSYILRNWQLAKSATKNQLLPMIFESANNRGAFPLKYKQFNVYASILLEMYSKIIINVLVNKDCSPIDQKNNKSTMRTV